MRKFEVGQRVRVVNRDSGDYGAICHIIAVDEPAFDIVLGAYKGYEVDTPHDECCDDSCLGHVYLSTDLIPIDDGHEKTTWSEMRKLGLWVPEGSEA